MVRSIAGDCFMVELIVCGIGYKFVSAGREDANVRMLGTGRPFYLELINPRVAKFTQEEYDTMQNAINSSDTKDAVQLRDLTNINP